MERMEPDLTMRVAVALGTWAQLDRSDSEIVEDLTFHPRDAAEHILAALGIDDLDAAVERAKKVAGEWNACDPPTSIPPDAVRQMVEAAFSATPSTGNDGLIDRSRHGGEGQS